MINKFCTNTKVVCGDKALEGLTFELQQHSVKKPLLVCDDMSYRLGYLQELLNAFNNYDIKFQVIYRDIKDTATVDQCQNLLKIYRANDCDGIVALGRKAVVQTAKCLKILLKDGISFINSYDSSNLSDYSIMSVPLFVVPTNFASGLEGSNKIRIVDDKSSSIYEFNTFFANTTAIVMDDRMTDTTPPKQIVSYGLYALSASTYAFLNSGDNMYVSSYARVALELVHDNLIPCILHNAKKSYRHNIMNAVVYAGLALSSLSNYSFIERLTYSICDRYGRNFPDVFIVLFRQYFKMHKWDSNMLQKILLHFVGEEDYAKINPVARENQAIASFEAMYEKIEDLIPFDNQLRNFGVEKSHFASIAENVIANTPKTKETTYRFIVELLEKCY